MENSFICGRVFISDRNLELNIGILSNKSGDWLMLSSCIIFIFSSNMYVRCSFEVVTLKFIQACVIHYFTVGYSGGHSELSLLNCSIVPYLNACTCQLYYIEHPVHLIWCLIRIKRKNY